jgi:hypothetical protein
MVKGKPKLEEHTGQAIPEGRIAFIFPEHGKTRVVWE